MPQHPPPTSRTPSDDPTPNEFTATVTEIRELSRIAGKPLFQLALDRSIFHPTPRADHPAGTLTATSRLGAVLVAPILAVHRDEHGELWHTTAKPLQPGTIVQCRPTPLQA